MYYSQFVFCSGVVCAWLVFERVCIDIGWILVQSVEPYSCRSPVGVDFDPNPSAHKAAKMEWRTALW